jgi:DNA-binding transcriptional MerR regulator
MYLSIGQLAKRTGERVKTLRYWTDLGLLDAERANNGYRLFRAGMAERVTFVRSSQALGFSLQEIKSILNLREAGTRPCEHVRRNLRNHLEQVRTRTKELKTLEHELEARLNWAEANLTPDCNTEGCVYLASINN